MTIYDERLCSQLHKRGIRLRCPTCRAPLGRTCTVQHDARTIRAGPRLDGRLLPFTMLRDPKPLLPQYRPASSCVRAMRSGQCARGVFLGRALVRREARGAVALIPAFRAEVTPRQRRAIARPAQPARATGAAFARQRDRPAQFVGRESKQGAAPRLRATISGGHEPRRAGYGTTGTCRARRRDRSPCTRGNSAAAAASSRRPQATASYRYSLIAHDLP